MSKRQSKRKGWSWPWAFACVFGLGFWGWVTSMSPERPATPRETTPAPSPQVANTEPAPSEPAAPIEAASMPDMPASVAKLGPYFEQVASTWPTLQNDPANLPVMCDDLIEGWHLAEDAAEDVERRRGWSVMATPLRDLGNSLYAAAVDCGHATQLYRDGQPGQAAEFLLASTAHVVEAGPRFEAATARARAALVREILN